ncbi:ribokinase [Coraliomargarita sp. SDUM461003]|uniref:Ribokinase n=1 Tax=Thalassobacterium maritimum TaxID=3041265 RepID=A0ABU1APL0_9BACT|nr:ribokinase [Coraliomargarita sp. SDUM461003]MDQ8206108.1 ribokinase [Coraliomargarita sp. SDUM461003]
MSPKITVIGSANIDYIMQMEHLPSPGETVTDGTFAQAFGGKGANQALAAAQAGAKVSFVGALGHDQTALDYKQSLEAHGIDCSQLSLEDEWPSGSAFVMIDRQGNNCISVAAGANAALSPERVHAVEALMLQSDWIILQQEIPQVSNQAVLAFAREHGLPVLLNYAPAHDLSLHLDAAVHGLVVNEIEAADLLDQSFEPGDREAVLKLAEALRRRGGHRFVAITLGAHGVVLSDAADCTYLPAFEVDAVDATAAGDTFCGALALALGEGQSLPNAGRFASAASALAVTQLGAQSSIPTRQAIDAFLLSQKGTDAEGASDTRC